MVSTTKHATRTPHQANSFERVYAAVKELAIECRFRPGDKINEGDLAHTLKVSRTPIREALNRLVSDGFVSCVPNRGFYARQISPEDVSHLYELRAAVESAAFKLACGRATATEINAAAKTWDDKTDVFRQERWDAVAEADEAFHLAIARLSKNPHLIAALEGLNSRILFFRRVDIQTPRRPDTEHAQIIQALHQREAAAGAELIERHITLSSARAIEVTKESLARIFFGHCQQKLQTPA